jgi:hypothetical protein
MAIHAHLARLACRAGLAAFAAALLVLATGCGSVRQLAHDQQVLPQGALQVATDRPLRAGSTVKLSAVFTPGFRADQAQFEYLWSFSGAAGMVSPAQSDEAEPHITLYAPGTLTVELDVSVVYQGTLETASYRRTLTVLSADDALPPASAPLAVETTGSLTGGQSVRFAVAEAFIPALSGVQYLWDFKGHANPSISTEATPTVVLEDVSETTPVTAATVTLSLVHGGIVESRTYPFYFTIASATAPLPADQSTVGVIISGEQVGGGSAAFALVPGTVPVALDAQYLWDFKGHANPDTSTEASPFVTFGMVTQPTTYDDCTVTLSTTEGGLAIGRTYHFSFTITDPADPLPLDGSVIPLEISGNLVGGQQATFAVAEGAIPNPQGIQYLWDFKGHTQPGTSTDPTPRVQFLAVQGPTVFQDCVLTLMALRNGEYETRVYHFSIIVTDTQ